MEEKINALNEEMLDEVSGGKDDSSKKHVEIVNCTHATTARSTPCKPAEGEPDNTLGFAYLGDRYVFYGWSGNWAKIQFGNKKAYVRKDRVKVY